jgi:hypothetical protein
VEAAIFIVIFWVAPAFVAHRLGKPKGRDNAWVWGALLGWIGVIVVAVQGNKHEIAASKAEPITARPTKRCPECAEEVLADAKVCRFCGHRLEVQSAP